MSDHIHFHIQEEIMKKLPVKSLVQFKCVSKTWKSLIESSDFIYSHSIHSHTQPPHLLVWYGDPVEEVNYVCFVDDDTFPQKKSVPTLPLSVKQLTLPTVIGSSHGLVCWYGSYNNYTTKKAVIWNPSIRKSIVVGVSGQPCVGFGVCPVTYDPKIMAITQSHDLNNCEAMVYTLSSRKWNPSKNIPTAPIRDAWSTVVTNKFIYWVAGLTPNMIMSFDVTNEYFKLIDLPDSLVNDPLKCLSISKVGESLAIFENRENICTTIWVMDDGVQGSFTKLFTIQAPNTSIAGFRKSDIPIVLVTDDDKQTKFVVYEPNSEHDNVLEISGPACWFNINS